MAEHRHTRLVDLANADATYVDTFVVYIHKQIQEALVYLRNSAKSKTYNGWPEELGDETRKLPSHGIEMLT